MAAVTTSVPNTGATTEGLTAVAMLSGLDEVIADGGGTRGAAGPSPFPSTIISTGVSLALLTSAAEVSFLVEEAAARAVIIVLGEAGGVGGSDLEEDADLDATRLRVRLLGEGAAGDFALEHREGDSDTSAHRGRASFFFTSESPFAGAAWAACFSASAFMARLRLLSRYRWFLDNLGSGGFPSSAI